MDRFLDRLTVVLGWLTLLTGFVTIGTGISMFWGPMLYVLTAPVVIVCGVVVLFAAVNVIDIGLTWLKRGKV